MNLDLYRPSLSEGDFSGWAVPRSGFLENFEARYGENRAPDLGIYHSQALQRRYADAIGTAGDGGHSTMGNPFDITDINRAMLGDGDPDLIAAVQSVAPHARPGEAGLDQQAIIDAYRPRLDDKLRRAKALNDKIPDPAQFDPEIAAESTRLREQAATAGEGASFAGDVGGLAGTAVGAGTRPEQLLLTIATAPVGGLGGSAAKTLLGRILGTAASEAGLNAAQQGAVEYLDYGTRKKLGTEASAEEIRRNILGAAVFGAALGGASRAIMPGLRAAVAQGQKLYRFLPSAGRDAVNALDSELQVATGGPGIGLERHAAGVESAATDVVNGLTPNQAALMDAPARSAALTPAARRSASDASGAAATISTRSKGFQARSLEDQTTASAPPSAVFDSRTIAPSQFFGRNRSSDIDPSTSKVYQAVNDVNALRQNAEELAPIAKDWLQQVVGPIEGAELKGVRPKAAAEIQRKIDSGGKRPDQVSDYLGGRVVVDSWDALDQVLRGLSDRARVLYLDDFLEAGKNGGYRAIHLQLLTKKGMSWELQILPREIANAYHDARAPYAAFKNRKLSAEELGAYAAAAEKAKATWNAAWQAWLDRNGPRPGGDRGGPTGGPGGYGGGPLAGNPSGRVFTATGRPLDVRYQVAEADRLVTSHDEDLASNPAFPQDLQPRDRARAASAAQIQEIAANLEPERLTTGADAGGGAPIIGGDDVVESGNGRVLAIRRAYDHLPEKAALYRQHLESLGFDTRSFNRPVLIRRRLTAMTAEERAAFVREANAAPIAAMSATERALSDARLLPDAALELYRGGDLAGAANRPFARAFLDALPASEHGGLVQADGALSKPGATRIRAALLAKAYSDTGLVAKFTESTDSNVVGIGNALTEIAPSWAQMRARAATQAIASEMDATPHLMAAVFAVDRARAEDISVGDLIQQGEMFGSGMTETAQGFLRLMFRDAKMRKPAGADVVAERLMQYVTEANKTQPGANLFGQAPASASEILHAAADLRAAAATAQADLLHAASPEAAAALDTEVARALERKDLQVPTGQKVEAGEIRTETKSARKLLEEADEEIAQMQSIASCAVGAAA